jgi:hypothetical protein
MSEPIFYIVDVEMPDHGLKEFMEWYAGVHAAHLYEAGFTTCASYRAVAGGLPIVDVYQSPSWDLFERGSFNRYRGIAAQDPYRPEFLTSARNMRTVYTHHGWSSAAAATASRPLNADWLTVWRFSGDGESGERVADWLAREGEARLLDLGITQIRLIRRAKDAPTGQSPRPSWALVGEWNTRPPANAHPDILLSGLVPPVADEEMFMGFRLYPWADDRAVRVAALQMANERARSPRT